MTEVSLLASQMAMPRHRHRDAHHCTPEESIEHPDGVRPNIPRYLSLRVQETGLDALLQQCREAIPTNPPEPRGKDADLRLMVDSDHAGDEVRW